RLRGRERAHAGVRGGIGPRRRNDQQPRRIVGRLIALSKLHIMMERLRRVPCWAWALVFSVALCLPRLGGFGFWDPSELKLADQAREIERSGHLLDPTAGGHYPAAKPLNPFLAAAG